MDKTSIVVGGGISGMLAASLLAKKGKQVLLVERESELGGLLRRFQYPGAGDFDYGMHNMYETGIAELDDFLFSLLPGTAWQVLAGPQRDLAGVYFNGKLQQNSLFMDLRELPRSDYEACLGSLFATLEKPELIDASSAESVARSRFGRLIAERAIAPALEKMFKRPAHLLDPMALDLTSLSRVILFDQGPFLDLMKSDWVRERVGYPEQRDLPLAFSSGRKSYYPRAYGMWRVVSAFEKRLLTQGVRIAVGSQVARVVIDGDSITTIELRSGDAAGDVAVEGVYWSTGLPALAGALGVSTRELPFDPPPKTVVVNLLLSERPAALGDLYYHYCYDPGFDTFRVTNYPAYSQGAVRTAGYPICVELLKHGSPLPDADSLAAQAVDELVRMGIVASAADIRFAQAEVLASGFPMPSLTNTGTLAEIRARIEARGIRNLSVLGVLSEPGIFFQRDVLRRTWEKLEAVQ